MLPLLLRSKGAPWYLRGGIPKVNCLAAYQPVGAVNLAGSYINVPHPGTHDANPILGSTPTWDIVNGWKLAGTSLLCTGADYASCIVPASDWSVILKFAGKVGTGDQFPFGTWDAANGKFAIDILTTGIGFYNGGVQTSATVLTEGVIAMANNKAYINGVDAGLTLTDTITSTWGLYIGALTSSVVGAHAYHFDGNILAIAFYDIPLTTPQITALTTQLQKDDFFFSIAIRQIIFDGNSMTDGTYSSYPATTMTLLSGYNVSSNFGVDGQDTRTMTADAVAQIDSLFDSAYYKNVVVCWEGTQDLKHGQTAAQAYANLVAYCQARQAAGFKVVIVTILPRTDDGLPGDFEASRMAVNANIRANLATFADALADVASDSRIGDDGDQLDATYYTDGTHMTLAGYNIIASYVRAAIEGI